MNHKPANELPGGGNSPILVNCLTWGLVHIFR